MNLKGSDLLKFMQNKISKQDYDELELWIISIGRSRFGIFKPKFYLDIKSDKYEIEYISTGAYLGHGWIHNKVYMKVGE